MRGNAYMCSRKTDESLIVAFFCECCSTCLFGLGKPLLEQENSSELDIEVSLNIFPFESVS